MKEFLRKHIGPKKISDLELSKLKTLMGKEVYLVKYYDHTEELLPKEIIQQVATKKPTDLTELRNLRVKPVVAKILAILAEADLTLEDVEYANKILDLSVEANIKKVVIKLWGKEYPQRTMMDIERILRLKPNENE